MGKIYALFNPLSANKLGEEKANKLIGFFPKEDIDFVDITKIDNYKAFVDFLEPDDKIVICGGDGTINRFANEIYDLGVKNEILYYATGSGNDFLRDLNKREEDGPVPLNDYLTDLPVVTVKGKDYRFINGVGYGIDGYCCEVGDKLRNSSTKAINYTSIAIKGLLFHYKPTNATVYVDGQKYEFKKVWIAPTMVGRFYGGGMMPAPTQNRNDRRDHVSLSLLHGSGKLKTLMIFPSLFKGEHIKHKKHVSVFTGKSITVEFDRPVALQIDGETILDVSRYEVKLGVYAKL
ncbi:MAG: diacylglycerol kinase family protein [Clostridia bacterium]|nr:diacylglycerol kinase family protein [Clostridia bacterium]